MQKFCHLLIFAALIISVSLAPTTQKAKSKLECLIIETVELLKNITTNPGKDRKMNIVSEEFNREDPKCIQKHIKTFIGGLPEKNQGIIQNLNEIAKLFKDSSCPTLDETYCNLSSTDFEKFKDQLIKFLNELPPDCQVLKPLSSAESGPASKISLPSLALLQPRETE